MTTNDHSIQPMEIRTPWMVSSPRLRLRMGPHIVRNEGPLGLFKGVDASMARQLVYSGVSWQIWHEI